MPPARSRRPMRREQSSDPVKIQIARRQDRALEEITGIRNEGRHPLLSSFRVSSASTREYIVRIRSVTQRLNSCTCPDYRTNTLGTCKHIEGVLMYLHRELGRRFDTLAAEAPEVVQIFLQHAEKTCIRVTPTLPDEPRLHEMLDRFFDPAGLLQGDPLRALPALLAEIDGLPGELQGLLRVDEEVHRHLDQLEDLESIRGQKQWFLRQVEHGARSLDVISTTLYPFQRDGMLHLAFGGRTLLADDMGLGKTVQAIAAASLLHQLRDIGRVLVVCPASLKHQWAREIRRFSSFEVAVVEGGLAERRQVYRDPPFFSIVNYELVRRDLDELLSIAPDLVILDEAQRIKNWRTKTADTVKRLSSRYAFVLTGTPVENRLDELYSVFQFIDPEILGPLWRFNDRYVSGYFRESGAFKVEGYKNLSELRRRISPYVLRRTRDEVLDDLPDRIDNTFFVELTAEQQEAYAAFERTAAQLMSAAETRPLTAAEHQALLGSLAKMRMICNALALHDPHLDAEKIERTAPKLRELGLILHDEVVTAGRKAILFSQWSRMLELVEPMLERHRIGYAKLTGKVATEKRGAMIDRFFEDDDCRIFLSTDAGGVGLNLQAASLVVNLELPWNPATLEQRAGRAHRHGQRHPVHVINLVTRGTIEERMLDTLGAKRTVFAGVFGAEEPTDELRFGDISTGLLRQLSGMVRPAAVQLDLDLTPRHDEPGQAGAAVRPGTHRSTDHRTSQLPPSEAHAAGASAPAKDLMRAGDPRSWRVRSPASLLRELSNRLLGLFPGRVLLVRRAPRQVSSEDGPAVLVVVDHDPGAMRPEAERLIAEVYSDADALPGLLLMEREGYAAFAALTGLDPAATGSDSSGAADECCYRAASLALAQGDREQLSRRLAKVRQGLEQAERKIRLARLLLEQEFPEEVLRPMREAMGWLLTAHLATEGPYEVSARLPPPRLVQARLVEGGIIDTESAASIARLRELSEPVGEDGSLPPPAMSTCAPLVELLEQLAEHGRRRIFERQL